MGLIKPRPFVAGRYNPRVTRAHPAWSRARKIVPLWEQGRHLSAMDLLNPENPFVDAAAHATASVAAITTAVGAGVKFNGSGWYCERLQANAATSSDDTTCFFRFTNLGVPHSSFDTAFAGRDADYRLDFDSNHKVKVFLAASPRFTSTGSAPTPDPYTDIVVVSSRAGPYRVYYNGVLDSETVSASDYGVLADLRYLGGWSGSGNPEGMEMVLAAEWTEILTAEDVYGLSHPEAWGPLELRPSLMPLLLSAADSGTTGTIAQTLPALSQSASGTLTFSGATQQQLPALTSAAVGTVANPVSGTISQALPALSQAVSATLGFQGSIAQTLPSLTQAAIATQTFEAQAAQTLPSLTQAAVGTLTFSATSAQTLPSLTQAASGTVTSSGIAGTIEQTLPALTQSASGTIGEAPISGTIAQTLPALTQAAIGTQTFSATIVQALPALSQAAQVSVGSDVSGTIAQTLPSLTQSLIGVVPEELKIPGYPGVPTFIPNVDMNSVRQHLQSVVAVVNRLNSGKINAVIKVTLAANASQTVVTDARLTLFGGVTFDPLTANAAAEVASGTIYVAAANRRSGEWTITHANNSQTDRQFRMVIIG